jgi:glycosyltransferase involved in cell wall biosynthesis
VRYIQTARDAITHRLPGARNLTWSTFYLAEATILARQLKAQGVQHLHAHFANSSASIARLAAKLARITWSMTLHGACDFEYPFGPTLPGKVREAAFTICISRYGMSQAMREVDPVHWSRIGLSRCGVDLSELPPPRGPAHNGESLNIVCVGRLSSEKGHLGLLEGFAQAWHQEPSLRLTLVGDGPQRERIESRIAELGLSERVTLTGCAAERAALDHIAAADIVVLASFMEGIPVVLTEAMALRVPVIAPRLAGIPELIEDGVSGFMFHPADWNDLAVKLVKLARDPDLRERFAQAGQERFENEYAMPHAIDGFVERLVGLGR